MTALHLWAQQIIQEEKQVMLPSFNGRATNSSNSLIKFDEVFLEKRIPINDSYIQADCIGRITKNEEVHDLLIEILVTHEVDEQKKDGIKATFSSCRSRTSCVTSSFSKSFLTFSFLPRT